MTAVAYRARIVELARADLGRLEESGHRGPLVRSAFAGCARDGKPLGVVDGLPWCAAWASRIVWEASGIVPPLELMAALWPHLPTDAQPVVGWRASVAELAADARATGALRRWSADDWQPGDLLLFGRDGESPLVGGKGHVVIVDDVVPGTLSSVAARTWTIGSDEYGPGGYGVRRATLPRFGEPLVGWVEVA